MIQTKWFTFASPPRTGCTWTRLLLESLGVEYQGARWHVPGRTGLPSITVWRDPADWLHSYFQMVPDLVGFEAVDCFMDLRVKGQEFSDFAGRYIEQMPGAIARLFGAYPSDYVLQLSEIRSGLLVAWREIGVPFDIVVLEAFPIKNAATRRATVSDELKARILEVG